MCNNLGLEIFRNCTLGEEEIIVKDNLRQIIKLTKERFSFDILKDIKAKQINEKEIELIYCLVSTIEEEECSFAIRVGNKAESISDLYSNAKEIEKNISKNFNIGFYK